MKVHVVKDRKGRVIATFERNPGAPRLEPKLQAGHKIEEVEAPDDYASDLKNFYAKHSKKKANS